MVVYLLRYPITRKAIKYHEAVATVLFVPRTSVEIKGGNWMDCAVFGM